MRLSAYFLILLCAWSANSAQALTLSERWGTQVSGEESASAAHFTVDKTANRTGALFKHFGKGLYELLHFKKDEVSKGLYEFAESFVNPLDDINAIVSDSAALIKSPQYLAKRVSHRVQVCTGNMGLIYDSYDNESVPYHSLIMPVDHVGIAVDGREAVADPGGGGVDYLKAVDGADCSDVPILSDEPEEVAIERMTFIGFQYGPKYEFLSANCAFFTRDVLSASGFAYPILPNLGIGAEYPITIHPKDFSSMKSEDLGGLNALRAQSESHMALLRTMFSELEAGKVPSRPEVGSGNDAIFQTIASASRGGNPEAQKQLNALYPVDLADELKWATPTLAKRLADSRDRKTLLEIFHGVGAKEAMWVVPYQDPEFEQDVTTFFAALDEARAKNPASK